MGEKRLDQYRSMLSSIEAANGMNAAMRNARRLVHDARTLLEKQRYPSAAALAVLSIEESGKLPILRRIVGAQMPDEAKDLWKDYRSHLKKNVMWLFPSLFATGARRLDDFEKLFDERSDHSELLDQIKQLSFYTDCLGNAHWSEPTNVIDDDLASRLVTIAETFARGETVTPIEIELWLKHVAPHISGNKEKAEAGLKAWYAELQKLGLKPAGPNEMAEFIDSGVFPISRKGA